MTLFQIFGCKSQRQTEIANGIDKLEYMQRSFIQQSKNSQAIVGTDPKIILWVGKQKYELSHSHNSKLTDPELEWLAYEVSQWLEIPITRTTSQDK
ncbi:MAG: hypothetical protein AB4352_03870 [Hormoscilla sp.]